MKLVKLQFPSPKIYFCPSPLIHYISFLFIDLLQEDSSLIHKIRSFSKNSDQILYLFGTQRSFHESMPFADSISSLTIIIRKVFKCDVNFSILYFFFIKGLLIVSFSFFSLLRIFAIQNAFLTFYTASFIKTENLSPRIPEIKIMFVNFKEKNLMMYSCGFWK